jgi:two-component system, NarL family, nitrate/nitrite response regulator NarL
MAFSFSSAPAREPAGLQLPLSRFSSIDIDVTPGPELIRILVVDDHILFRGCLTSLLAAMPQYEVVGEAKDAENALRLLRELKPDLLLCDWELSQAGQMRILRELQKCDHAVKTILLTLPSHETEVASTIQLGVAGILSNEATPASLCDAIGKVMQGQYVLGRAGLASLVNSATDQNEYSAFQKTRRKFGITRREYEIVSEVVAGYSSAEIAERLSLSCNTLKHHMSHIYDKLGVSNRLELVLFALNHELVSRDR